MLPACLAFCTLLFAAHTHPLWFLTIHFCALCFGCMCIFLLFAFSFCRFGTGQGHFDHPVPASSILCCLHAPTVFYLYSLLPTHFCAHSPYPLPHTTHPHVLPNERLLVGSLRSAMALLPLPPFPFLCCTLVLVLSPSSPPPPPPPLVWFAFAQSHYLFAFLHFCFPFTPPPPLLRFLVCCGTVCWRARTLPQH